jgi:hypothetical protein
MAYRASFEDFLSEYTIVDMARNSVKFQNKHNGDIVYLHRNNLRKHNSWQGYSIEPMITPTGMKIDWVCVTTSSCF